MKKSLTHADIRTGQRYKVIGTPKQLLGMGKYPWLNMTGEAIWVNVNHNMVGMQFGACKIRGIPPGCLEETENKAIIIDCSKMPQSDPGAGIRLIGDQLMKEREPEQKNIVTQNTAKLEQLYRIVKIPPYWIKISGPKPYPSMGAVGRLIKMNDSYGTLKLAGGTQRFVPFDCMEPVTIRIPPIVEMIVQLNDEELIARMVQKPLSTLKIIKGLAKMNKDYRLRSFLDRGAIFW